MNIRWLHVTIDLPADVDDDNSRFWAAALGWPLGEPWRGHPEFCSFEPPVGDSYVARQVIEDGSPRVHLDIAVDDVDEVSGHMQAIGARPGPVMSDWRVMTSPGGMPYCLVTHRDDNQMPGAMTWTDDGHRSRLVQVCVDSSAERHEHEVEFWKAATHWRWAPSPESPEFAGKLHPEPGSPVQLLFQRLDEDGDPETRAHIDLGADDVEAEAARLEGLGARRLWPGDGWIALEDPAGLPFCATANRP
jgi:hypothetical protein